MNYKIDKKVYFLYLFYFLFTLKYGYIAPALALINLFLCIIVAYRSYKNNKKEVGYISDEYIKSVLSSRLVNVYYFDVIMIVLTPGFTYHNKNNIISRLILVIIYLIIRYILISIYQKNIKLNIKATKYSKQYILNILTKIINIIFLVGYILSISILFGTIAFALFFLVLSIITAF